MPPGFDDWMTGLWLGLACLSLSIYLVSRRITLLEIAIFWFACFPILEGLIRESLRATIKRHPEELWVLKSVVITIYGLVILIVAFRVWRYRLRRFGGIGRETVADSESR